MLKQKRTKPQTMKNENKNSTETTKDWVIRTPQ